MNSTYRTVVPLPKFPFQLTHQNRLMTLGSCFSENIGQRFLQAKFNIAINPFGQQYNPYSMAKGIERLLAEKIYTADELISHDELFHSWHHHSDFSKPTEAETLDCINQQFLISAAKLKQCDYLFLTFGTAHVFSLKTTGEIVSNCHKLSGGGFDKRYLSPAEIEALITTTIKQLRMINPDVKIILTVSPVRYLAFGMEENTLSKAHLFTAVHQLKNKLEDVFYFPAYELVMDDLRDYRFFTEDMLHPNRQATQYVWDGIVKSMIAEPTSLKMEKINEVIAAANHKPRNSKSAAHQKFQEKYLKQIAALQADLATADFDEEIKKLKLS